MDLHNTPLPLNPTRFTEMEKPIDFLTRGGLILCKLALAAFRSIPTD